MLRILLACLTAPLLLVGCGNDLGAGANTSASSGLPCDVQAVLADRCLSCHGSQLSGGAPVHLATYADLTQKNASGVTLAERALIRMTSASSLMPPPPASAATSTDIATMQAWMTAGMPSGECMGGAGAFDGPMVCTSGTMWTRGNHESPDMHPGVACINCHASGGEGPRFKIAGTVYPTGHEPDDCNGATSATVEVTDATGKLTSLAVNGAGNFYSSATFQFPIQVAVVANGVRRAMTASPPSGDCNTCHTPDGANQAPGRIALP